MRRPASAAFQRDATSQGRPTRPFSAQMTFKVPATSSTYGRTISPAAQAAVSPAAVTSTATAATAHSTQKPSAGVSHSYVKPKTNTQRSPSADVAKHDARLRDAAQPAMHSVLGPLEEFEQMRARQGHVRAPAQPASHSVVLPGSASVASRAQHPADSTTGAQAAFACSAYAPASCDAAGTVPAGTKSFSADSTFNYEDQEVLHSGVDSCAAVCAASSQLGSREKGAPGHRGWADLSGSDGLRTAVAAFGQGEVMAADGMPSKFELLGERGGAPTEWTKKLRKQTHALRNAAVWESRHVRQAAAVAAASGKREERLLMFSAVERRRKQEALELLQAARPLWEKQGQHAFTSSMRNAKESWLQVGGRLSGLYTSYKEHDDESDFEVMRAPVLPGSALQVLQQGRLRRSPSASQVGGCKTADPNLASSAQRAAAVRDRERWYETNAYMAEKRRGVNSAKMKRLSMVGFDPLVDPTHIYIAGNQPPPPSVDACDGHVGATLTPRAREEAPAEEDLAARAARCRVMPTRAWVRGAVGTSQTVLLTVCNEGGVTLFCRWERRLRQQPQSAPIEAPKFFCRHESDIRVLPNEKIGVEVVFSSATAGVFLEEWTLLTTPPLDSSINIELRGVAISEPEISSATHSLQAQLNSRVVESMALSLVLDLVGAAIVPLPPPPPPQLPTEVLHSRAWQHENGNRKLCHNAHVFAALEDLGRDLDALRPATSHHLDPIHTSSASILHVEKKLLALPPSDERTSYLGKIDALVSECCAPPNCAHRSVSSLIFAELTSLADAVVDAAETGRLRSLDGLENGDSQGRHQNDHAQGQLHDGAPAVPMLVLHSLSARHLPDLDLKKGSGTSDPYLRATLLGAAGETVATARTSTLPNDENPQWHDELALRLVDQRGLRDGGEADGVGLVAAKLWLEVFDDDVHRQDTLIASGEVEIPISNGQISASLQLADRAQAVPVAFAVRLEGYRMEDWLRHFQSNNLAEPTPKPGEEDPAARRLSLLKAVKPIVSSAMARISMQLPEAGWPHSLEAERPSGPTAWQQKDDENRRWLAARDEAERIRLEAEQLALSKAAKRGRRKR